VNRSLLAASAALGLVLASCATAVTPSPAPAGTTAPPGGTPTASPSTSATLTSSPAASPSPSAGAGGCEPARLTARITRWEGAAGSSIAHVEVTNPGPDACLLAPVVRPQLVDAKGGVLVEGAPGASASSSPLTPSPSASPIAPAPSPSPRTVPVGGVVTTLVRIGNYCGPAPATPLSVAFVLPAGTKLVAAPLSPTDETVPTCLGAPGSTATIEMQAWAP
jgi:hypothetical protein